MSAPAPRPGLGVRLLRAVTGFGPLHPSRSLLFGYLGYVLAGWALLSLPWVQKGHRVGALDTLFVSVSAVSTTGLATVSVADRFNEVGQFVILALIQLGGIGYMTMSSFLILSRSPELPTSRSEVGKAVFSLPEGYRIDKFIRSVVRFTVVIELAGALALYPVFRRAGVESPLWSAVFHSVSAFCTAGFGLHNDSFESYAADPWLNGIIAALALVGAMGFIVCVDVWRMLRGKTSKVTFTTKVILWSTLSMGVAGTALIFVGEPSLQGMAPERRLLAAGFQCMTAFTTVGFNTVGMAGLSKATIFIMVVLMIVGSSPSGTGGGLKCTTISALLGIMGSALRGEREVRFFGRSIPLDRVLTACASLGFYLMALAAGAWLLELTETSAFDQNLFEAASALGTVGLSLGITGGLSPLGKLVVIALMFLGRVGPLTFGTALFWRKADPSAGEGSDLAV